MSVLRALPDWPGSLTEVIVELNLELPVKSSIVTLAQGQGQAGGEGDVVLDEERGAEGQVDDVHAVAKAANGGIGLDLDDAVGLAEQSARRELADVRALQGRRVM